MSVAGLLFTWLLKGLCFSMLLQYFHFLAGLETGDSMCIAVWLWQAHPHYPLLLLLNRDEFHERPTTPTSWWGDSNEILGGRDGVAGGTWLACTRNGKLAFLTNVLEPDPFDHAKSRGDLTLRFLESGKSPIEFAKEVVKEADLYNGFNLILADLCAKTMVYVSNRPRDEAPSIQEVSPGLHVLSNARLDSPWHKAQRLGQNFKELIRRYRGKEISSKDLVELLMKDKVKADKDELPRTGCDPDWESKLSSIFVEVDTPLGRYGTRSTAAVFLKASGEISFYEQYLEKGVWKEHTVKYEIEKTCLV